MKRALIDFDGVIHRYGKGWADGTAYDEPMPGAKEGLEALGKNYEVVIFSTRDADQIEQWLIKHQFPRYRITNVKEPAEFMLDDRAIRFRNWGHSLWEIEKRYGVQ